MVGGGVVVRKRGALMVEVDAREAVEHLAGALGLGAGVPHAGGALVVQDALAIVYA
jgi:hypothetical protein